MNGTVQLSDTIMWVTTELSSSETRVFTARDVQQLTGLSSRQLNDWDSRGVLPHGRDVAAGWRRFSVQEVFSLMVVMEFRRKFGVPVERVRFVIEQMNAPGADYLGKAVEQMATYGLGVWIATDFESHFLMHWEAFYSALWNTSYFDDEKPEVWCYLRVNRFVNEILASGPNPMNLPSHGMGRQILQHVLTIAGMKSAEEFQILQMIRSGDFKSIEVIAPSGRVETIKATTSPKTTDRLVDLLKEHKYQKLTVTQKDGRVVDIEQSFTQKAGSPKQNTP